MFRNICAFYLNRTDPDTGLVAKAVQWTGEMAQEYEQMAGRQRQAESNRTMIGYTPAMVSGMRGVGGGM